MRPEQRPGRLAPALAPLGHAVGSEGVVGDLLGQESASVRLCLDPTQSDSGTLHVTRGAAAQQDSSVGRGQHWPGSTTVEGVLAVAVHAAIGVNELILDARERCGEARLAGGHQP